MKFNPIIILLNNNGYKTERAIHDGPFNDLHPWYYHELPRSFDLRYYTQKAVTIRDFAFALEDAFRHADGPSFIEAVLDEREFSQPLKAIGRNIM
ncbi:MAG: hypothetical protein HQK54_15125 [Oligoflexales bacterium]|nr:hypothetical protein [Oligoflexales bacterium]